MEEIPRNGTIPKMKQNSKNGANSNKWSKNRRKLTTLKIFSSFISNEIPRPLEDDPGLMIQMFMNPSTIDSGLNFKILSRVLLHCEYKFVVVTLSSEWGVWKYKIS